MIKLIRVKEIPSEKQIRTPITICGYPDEKARLEKICQLAHERGYDFTKPICIQPGVYNFDKFNYTVIQHEDYVSTELKKKALTFEQMDAWNEVFKQAGYGDDEE